MTTVDPPRPLDQRIADTRHLLETAVDAWVSTADPSTGRPWLVPLSFAWTNSVVVLGTGADSRTVLSAVAQPWIRLGIGAVRDVVLVHGTAAVVSMADVDRAEANLFAERSGFDPRAVVAVRLRSCDAAPDPGLARGERAGRARDHARRPLALLRSEPTPRCPCSVEQGHRVLPQAG